MMLCGIYAALKLSGFGQPLPNLTLPSLFKSSMIYNIPGSMGHIGDKSVAYQLLRQEYDALYPPDDERSLAFVASLHKRTYTGIDVPGPDSYNIYNCPDEPPPGYPYQWQIMDLINHWPPDDATPRADLHQGLCVFDFRTDYQKAIRYRKAELPFVVRRDPEVARSVERWNAPGYMARLMADVPHRTEYSPNNHFMYWMKPNLAPGTLAKRRGHGDEAKEKKRRFGYHVEAPSNWTQPTQMMRMKYTDWVTHANVTDDHLGPDQPHWYYRLIGCGEMGKCDAGSSEYLFDELTFFQPKPGLYLVEHDKQKGIHCRFGMKGVIAENHFDQSRNSIVVLGGERRYILAHPDQCPNLLLYPKEHPSARHSMVDWSQPDLETFPDFAKARANEVVLQPGDIIYLPTNWFHYIISLELNYQCNTRSGIGPEYMLPIQECGF
jgi:hypothetical protein